MKYSGSWVTEELNKLDDDEKRGIFEVDSVFCVGFIVGLREVWAEKMSKNDAAEDDHLPVYPGEYALISTIFFISKVLEPFRSHIFKHWTA